MNYKFKKEMYSKMALLKASYSFIDRCYIHLDCDENYYYVIIEPKNDKDSVQEREFLNEMLAQAVRHEVYLQTKSIRELMLARAMATSIVGENKNSGDAEYQGYSEDAIIKDWFEENEES